MARKLGVKKAEILDSTTEDMAVRLALAETNIINETKEYFVQNGISLDSFGQSKKKSPTVILVKNIPGSTEENEIIELFKPFGDLGRIVLPPARTIAIIEFPDRNEAKVAFRKLAYKKFKNLPLYLEWAPENIFDEEFGKFSQEKSLESLPEQAKTIADSQDMDLTPAATVFVKNLNFSTTDEGFKSAFSTCDGLRSAKISFKKNVKSPKNMLSMGFGFLEFDTKENAMACIKTMQV
jgi:multiple RNA-binding domain-containing protein 1